MARRSALKASLPALLVLACCGYSIFTGVQDTEIRLQRSRIAVEAMEARVEGVRRHLNGVDAVGYVIHRNPRDRIPPGAYFFITQYALAPIRVYDSLDYRYIVGIFHLPSALKTMVEENDLKVVEDFHNGVVLLENREGK